MTSSRPALSRIDPDPLSPLNQMQKYLVHEFIEDFQDGLLSRRDLMAKIGHIVGGAGAAAAVLAWFGVSTDDAGAQEANATPGPVEAQSPLSVPEGDPSVIGTEITYDSAGVTYTAYEARPSGTAATPAADLATPMAESGGLVLVCHENRGLTPHIQDVARRLAKSGYVAVAVDLLSPEGGTASIADQTAIPGILTEGDLSRHSTAFQDAITYYETNSEASASRVGMVGFCFGGGITWTVATLEPRLKAAVPFYGPPPDLANVPNIAASVLGVYSDDPDDFANNGRDELVAALEAAGKTFEIKIFPGTQHAFHNDTGQRYNEEQSLAAWVDTLAWFQKYLVA